MKKYCILLLSILYLLVASGFTFSLHYCAGKLKSVSLLPGDESSCCGTKKKSKGCCKEKIVVYKLNDDHNAVSKTTAPSISIKYLIPSYSDLAFTFERIKIELYTLPNFHAPPVINPAPVYLLNRNFRI